MCTSQDKLGYAVVTNNPKISVTSHQEFMPCSHLCAQWKAGQSSLLISQSLRDPGWAGAILTQATRSVVWMGHITPTHISLTRASHMALTSRGRKVPSCHLPIRTENRNTWTAAFMPVTSRLTNHPHLLGPRGFLDCRTVTRKPENILGKQNKLFPSYIFFTNTLLYDCTTDYLVAKSWFFSLIPCS